MPNLSAKRVVLPQLVESFDQKFKKFEKGLVDFVKEYDNELLALAKEVREKKYVAEDARIVFNLTFPNVKKGLSFLNLGKEKQNEVALQKIKDLKYTKIANYHIMCQKYPQHYAHNFHTATPDCFVLFYEIRHPYDDDVHYNMLKISKEKTADREITKM
jgi:hypothetical protein